MSKNLNNNISQFYYSGGFAEIVSSPSLLTYSFLKDWFSGAGSLGNAMELLNLPYTNNYHPLLELVDHELLLNLKIEESTLYENTIFSYKKQNNLNSLPKLSVKAGKLIFPLSWRNTLKILVQQSKWISKQNYFLDTSKSLISNIPEARFENENLDSIDEKLKNEIWPSVIAVGFLSEFYLQLLLQESKEKFNEIQSYISLKASSSDWYFLSIKDQIKVKNNEMSFDDYLKKYGIRADKDYELTSQRWHEIPEKIKERIQYSNEVEEKKMDVDLYGSLDNKLKKLVDISLEFQLLRSEAKRKTLISIDLLRKFIIADFCNQNCIHGDDCSIQSKIKRNKYSSGEQILAENENRISLIEHVSSGKGIPVSAGIASGIAKHIVDNDVKIPIGTIGIFINSSPEFSMQYAKCSGMIFLRGGQTSHGATVAREYGIPSLVDDNAATLIDGVKIQINGATGEWEVEKPIIKEIIKEKHENESYAKFIKSLGELELNDKNKVGGKAFSLGQLIKLGLSVPDGFVITSEAFSEFFEKDIPEEFITTIVNKFKELKLDKVAVRSSALSEDSKGSSWAGQLESYLNISEGSLIENITKCWDSVNSARVKSYAKKNHVNEKDLEVAIIIQEMIIGDVSGVTFTKNPVSGDKDEMVIEAATGLAEKVVQGEINPQRYLIDKKSYEIKNKDEIKDLELLNPEVLNKLCDLALKIEANLGALQDIEWTIDDNKIYILQSRPITT